MEVLESLAIVMVTMQLTMMKTKAYKKDGYALDAER